MSENPQLMPVVAKLLAKPGLRHGFFTRNGGVSSGVYASLNAGPGSNDDVSSILENRGRIATELGVKANHLLSPFQFHSSEVVIVDQPFSAERPRADGIVTAKRGLAIGVLTADCGPLLFADRKAGVIGAAHAGWKGAVGGVIENTVSAMETLGARKQDIVAVLGPTIGQGNYEVGADFEADLLARDSAGAAFFVAGLAADKRMFDLPGYIMMRLTSAGVQSENLALCTYANAGQFFSYRRSTHKSEIDYGRQLSALCLE